MTIGKKYIIVPTILLLGFVYRIFLSTFALGGLFWDMETYHAIAQRLLSGNIAAECCQKNAGYGVFLAGVYFLFGANNLTAVRVVQAACDCIVALLIYIIAMRQFNRRAALFSLFLYLVNPLTSSYTGLRLPETISILLVTFIAVLVVHPLFKIKKNYWFGLGLLLGLLLFTRLQYYYFVFIIIVVYAVSVFRKLNIIRFVAFSLLGFFIASSYSLFSYYHTYKIISLVPPYSNYYHDLYMNFYNDYKYPELSGNYSMMRPEYARLAYEYFTVPISEKPLYNAKYRQLFFQKIRTDWPIFFRNTIRNMIWLWNKDHLYTYTDIFYPADSIPLMVANSMLLLVACTGVMRFSFDQRKKVLHNPLYILTLLLFIYITCMFTLVSNESRHSLVYYPLLMLWAGYGREGIGKMFHVPIDKHNRDGKIRTL